MLTIAGLWLLVWAAPASAYLTGRYVPLPKPRPAEAPQATKQILQADKPSDAETAAKSEQTQIETRPAEPPPPSACRLALTDVIAVAPSIPSVHGPGACGGDDLVRLEAVILPNKSRVAVKPAAILRCTMAAAVADWIRSDIAPMVGELKTSISELDNFDSFECRGRNRMIGAKMSEHGRANALDVRALKLADGRSIALTERGTARDLRERVLGSVCERFSTVLGPGSDGYHEDHIHLDLAERRGNYRICQWDVWEAMPLIAPLMPAVRPDGAPPREVADKTAEKTAEKIEGKSVAPPAEAAAPANSEDAEPEPPPPAKPAAKARKRRVRAAPSPFGFLR